MRFSFSQFIREQLSETPPVQREDLSQKTIIVSGANQGLGFEAAKHFARMSPGRLVLACRNKELGNAAVANIQKETGCQSVELWILDLANFASVIAFYERAQNEAQRIDILVANAAVVPSGKEDYTTDGWAPGLQVNNLSTNLLTILLYPIMQRTATEFNTRPRIVVVASEVHYWAKISTEVIDSESPWRTYNEPKRFKSANGTARYFETKLLNVLFVRALAERIQYRGGSSYVTITAINPGFCLTSVRKNQTGMDAIVSWIFEKWLARTTEEGSRQLVWAALDNYDSTDAEAGRQLHGAYCSAQKTWESSDWVISAEGKRAQDRMWDDMIIEFQKIDPRVNSAVDKILKS